MSRCDLYLTISGWTKTMHYTCKCNTMCNRCHATKQGLKWLLFQQTHFSYIRNMQLAWWLTKFGSTNSLLISKLIRISYFIVVLKILMLIKWWYRSSPIMSTTEPWTVSIFSAHGPISFQHMSLWYMLLEPCMTTYHLDIDAQSREVIELRMPTLQWRVPCDLDRGLNTLDALIIISLQCWIDVVDVGLVGYYETNRWKGLQYV